jgi:osmotically-inducible protein OsmY
MRSQTTTPGSIPNTTTSNNNQVLSLDDAAERIDEAFDQDATLKEFDLDADDEQNTIVLEGRVRDSAQQTLAEDIAHQVAPSATIVNQIAIQ